MLDAAQPPQVMTNTQKDFISSLKATITYIQKPCAIDVDAGLWCVKNPRAHFTLDSDAPAFLKEQVCRTSKMIMAWGIEIEIILPEMITTQAFQNTTLAAMDLPTKVTGPNGNKLLFEAGGDTYPLLLGVIADII